MVMGQELQSLKFLTDHFARIKTEGLNNNNYNSPADVNHCKIHICTE